MAANGPSGARAGDQMHIKGAMHEQFTGPFRAWCAPSLTSECRLGRGALHSRCRVQLHRFE